MSQPSPHQPLDPPAGSFAARAEAGSYDEWFSADGRLRESQRRLYEFFTQSASADLSALRRVIRGRIDHQEVTFNLLGAPGGTARPWHLDAIPLLMDVGEWQVLETGLQQRARLLSAMHQDFFGPRRLLHAGVVPPQLVLGHPSFARACSGWLPVGGHRLHVYAADVSRDADGHFVVYSDRTAAPAGAGYALENRLVLGRSLSGLFEDYDVERVRGFFDVMRRCVQELSPQSTEEPRVVLLSAGAQDESSFEHAYLARYLGYELVEGRDLTVRDSVVYLKTLSGLKRVDVVFRRIHDLWCDPLELKEDSFMGVPGLVEAAMEGSVALVNPLGVNMLESAAMKPYLPAACEFLLGESLQLPSVETLWCGDESAFQSVLQNLESYDFKPAFEDRRGSMWSPVAMSAADRASFVERLQAAPARYVAERWPRLAGAPVLDDDGIRYGSVALRAFICRDGDDYRVMPGGLARVDATPDGLFLTDTTGEATKDVWVPALPQGWGKTPTGMPDRRVELRRGGLDLPSRLLDDIYWLGRYVERAEMTARLLRAGFDRCNLEVAGAEQEAALAAVVEALIALEVVSPGSVKRTSTRAALTALLEGALVDASNASSLRSVIGRLHQLTVTVRSRLSRDAWNVLKRLSEPLEGLYPEDDVGPAIEALDEILLTLSAVSGTTMDNMVRGHVWMFLDMGRRVERGILTVSVIRAMLPAGATLIHMKALLEIADSLLTYRARYLSSLQVAPVVDLLMTDATNPRSLLFQVDTLQRHIAQLPRLGDVVRSRAEQRIISLNAALLTADVMQACSGDGNGLRELLEDCGNLLWQFSDDVTQSWFTHADTSHAVAAPQWIDEELEAP